MPNATYTLRPLASSAPLSKSKFVHGMQCPLYVWLEVRTDLPRPEPDPFTLALFASGHEVGEYARLRWDARQTASGKPPGVRVTDDPTLHEQAVAETAAALAAGADVIHEASFTHGGVKVRVDVLERYADGTFGVNEVKSTGTYDEAKHLLDASVQLWVARGAGLRVSRVNLVHLNEEYEWPGGDYDLERLFADEDITPPAEALQESIGVDVARLLRLLGSDEQPVVAEHVSCDKPYGCPYLEVCPGRGEPVEHPISELPGRTDALCERAEAHGGYASLLELDEATARQVLRYANGSPHRRWYTTWKATVTGRRIVLPECPEWLAQLACPIRHLDFETVAPPLPVVAHTRPFQVVPLQYSIHTEHADSTVEHREFLADASDADPRRRLVERLLGDLGESGAILQWSSYEATVLRNLAEDPRYAEYRDRLLALVARMRDLGMAVSDWVFDRDFHGRWSIKVVYPVLVPGADPGSVHDENPYVSYDDLDGVARGDEATILLVEYLRGETTPERRAELRRQLLQYCELDTWAMVQVLRALRAECEALG